MSAKKIKTQSELQALAKELSAKDSHYKARVLICMTGCRALGAQNLAAKFRQRLKELELENIDDLDDLIDTRIEEIVYKEKEKRRLGLKEC